MTTHPLARLPWRGRTNVDAITAAALEAAERIAGREFVVTQGSYQSGRGDVNSAGTHDLGGVVDLSTRDLNAHQKRRMIRALREVGFAAWLRTTAQGPWVEHVHALLLDHPYMAAGARRQQDAYLAGRNGLANNGPDDGPRLDPIPRFTWPPEDDMPYTDWPEKDRNALVRDIVNGLQRRDLFGDERDDTPADAFRTVLRLEAKVDKLIRALGTDAAPK